MFSGVDSQDFGVVPDSVSQDFMITENRQYVFTFSTWTKKAAIQSKMTELEPYAKNISVETSGLTTAKVTLTPLNKMPLSAWRSVFSGIGLSDMKDFFVGSVKDEKQPAFSVTENLSKAYTPALKALGSGLGTAFDYVKWVAVAGAVIVGGIVILVYLPKPKRQLQEPVRQYQENPKKRKRSR